MSEPRPTTAAVEVGQVYLAWGKRWRVTRVWPDAGVAEAVNVSDESNRIRWPLTAFVERDESEGESRVG